MLSKEDVRKVSNFIFSKVSGAATTTTTTGGGGGWRAPPDAEHIALRGLRVPRPPTADNANGRLPAASSARAVLALPAGPTLDAARWACHRLGLPADAVSALDAPSKASAAAQEGAGRPFTPVLIADARGGKAGEAQELLR